ncbi:hypothetical protein [Hyphomicrobium sp. ghe19]|uniref:hypothetical protein n=1 Tax=Hyphomicrobium sp. ghe19 TaxID=2682968 RepID=UPI0013678971|nr:hypothetical protein HYPP_01508 [Hyphomicrobium sp. ghe19]
MNEDKLSKAAALEAEARLLRSEAFNDRPLPDFWRVGQKVRTLERKEWAWSAGAIMTIVEVRDPKIPAKDYQVFWTRHHLSKGGEKFWTEPNDVELVEDN